MEFCSDAIGSFWFVGGEGTKRNVVLRFLRLDDGMTILQLRYYTCDNGRIRDTSRRGVTAMQCYRILRSMLQPQSNKNNRSI
mmetsp:Transcript_10777/g.22952  ORF Transcript_10777/g.22952 Transcript_10777/m.22952 type:complete len:82 (-) Transcript_10777:1344-1589(-)